MKTIVYFLFATDLLLSGCQQFASLHQFGRLQKGMTAKQVEDIIGVSPTLTVKGRGMRKEDTTSIYMLGFPVPTTTVTVGGGTYGGGTRVTITDRLLVYFVDGKARYWGYPSDFFRSDEEDVIAAHKYISRN